MDKVVVLSETDVDVGPPCSEAVCFHCHLPLDTGSVKQFDAKQFCCQGCLSVYKILQVSGLHKFYELSSPDDVGKRLQDYNSDLSFAHFDEGSEKEKTFYLEGVHCLACLWLIENSQTCVPGVSRVRLNMSTSQVQVEISDQGRFSEVARWFNKLGYFPHLLKDATEGATLQKQENYQMLKRIGVAGFSAGNIMLLAVSIYGGVQGEFFSLFSWLSAALYVPAFLYSAWPFYSNAYHKLLQKKMALDIPVAVVLILGSVISFINVFRGSEHFYFDSLAVFIFLLLSARFFLKRIQQRHAGTQGVQSLFESTECLKQLGTEYVRVSVKDLRVQDRIRLLPGESVPLDLRLESDRVYLNTALITGEHLPRLYQKGETILAGSIVVSGNVEGQVVKSLKDCELGKVLESIERSWLKGGDEVQLADKLATYLLVFAFALSAVILFYFYLQNNLNVGIERAMAVLIVTCPCALGLGTPLAFIQGLKNLFKKQVIAKNGDILKKVSEVKNVYFDKTGTMTQGRYSVVEVDGSLNDDIASAIFALERNSIHPVAVGLCAYVKQKFLLDESLNVEDLQEKLGSGIFGTLRGRRWAILKSQRVGFDVDVLRDEERLLSVRLDDPIKTETAEVLRWLRKHKINVFMLTGDHLRNAQKVASQLGFLPEEIFADHLPAAKAERTRFSENSLMVGDGYNDVVAFENAYIGVALGKKVDLQLKNADVFIPSGRLEDLLTLLKEASATKTRLQRNFTLSVFYNLIGIVGSVVGLINPLGAAILMPVSSLTILVSSVWKDGR